MAKSMIGAGLGKSKSAGLSSRSPKDAGSPSVKPKSGAVVGVRKSNNKRSMGRKGC